jgi:hypothetical protein
MSFESLLAAPDPVVVACAICFGNADSPLLDAARIGVLTMVGVTVCVLGGFARWFVRLSRLARERESND